MKKILNYTLILLALLAVFFTHSIVRAQQTAELAQEQATVSVNYILPYPGILPDNPLYKIKMIRDRVISWFIFDPVKKAEYYLLMADKRINAGKMLIEYGKVDLGQETISKGENYLSLVFVQINKAKEQGKDASEIIDKVDKATSKHLEVLETVLEKAPESAQKGLKNALENSQKGHENVLMMKNKGKEKNKNQNKNIKEENLLEEQEEGTEQNQEENIEEETE